MKISLFIEDGIDQVILTPESEAERTILTRFRELGQTRTVNIRTAQLYANRAGTLTYAATGFNGRDFDSTFVSFERLPKEANE